MGSGSRVSSTADSVITLDLSRLDPFAPHPKSRPIRRLLLALLLALLAHTLFLSLHLELPAPTTPPRVEVQQIDPQKLEAIRKKWQTEPKGLLLDRDPSKPSEKEAPPNARYQSDRNIRVEKETRARDSVLIPKPGSPAGANEKQAKEKSKPQPKSEPRSERRIPDLGALGVPLPIPKPGEQKKPPSDPTQDRPGESSESRAAAPLGGSQYIPDRSLPVGSENLLNAEESVYYSFYARLYDAIAPIWQSKVREVPAQRRLNEGEYITVVDVVLDSEGNLKEVRLLRGSGVLELDQIVEASWRRIGRFPNPPQGLLNPEGEVHTGWTFALQVGGGFGFRSLPPERNY